MRKQPDTVTERLAQVLLGGHRIVVSAVTYAEMRGKAILTAPRVLIDAFCTRLDAVLPWDRAAVDATTDIKVALRLADRPERDGDCRARHRRRCGAGDE